MLDAPRPMVDYLARLLAAYRRLIGTPRGSRKLGPFRQAVFVLRWFREAGCVHCLARDVGVSQATGYRYLHEGIDVLAARAPDLHHVLARCRAEGLSHVVLDGALISCDRVAGLRENGNDLWYSGTARRFAGNIQFLAAPDGTPLWISEVEPGSTPDITAARIHALPALYKVATDGLPTLADLGYQGVGIGIHTPVPVHPDRPKSSCPETAPTTDSSADCVPWANALLPTSNSAGEPPTRHPQPHPHRSHHPSRPCTQPSLEMTFAEKT